MEFVPRRAEDLTNDKLVAAAGLDVGVTDLNVGSVLRTFYEADSLVEEDLDTRYFEGLVTGIPEELYTAFDFERLPAVPTTASIRFVRAAGSIGAAIPIPAGAIVASPPTALESETRYAVLSDTLLAAGINEIDVTVRCTVAGTVGNAPAGAISVLISTVDGIASVSNPSAALGGLDTESDSARQTRFARFIEGLRGSTDAGIESAARRVLRTDGAGAVIERVDRAVAVDSYVAGRTDVYIDNGGGDASDELKALVQAKIDGGYTTGGARVVGYKASGIVVRVFGTHGVPVAVAGTLTIEPGYDFTAVRTAVIDAVTLFLYDLGVFRELIWADLVATVVEVEGVKDVTLTTPAGNRVPSFEQRLLPGVVAFTRAG